MSASSVAGGTELSPIDGTTASVALRSAQLPAKAMVVQPESCQHVEPQPSGAPQGTPAQVRAQHPDPVTQVAPQKSSAPHTRPAQIGLQQASPGPHFQA